jgi:hypothetical protein
MITRILSVVGIVILAYVIFSRPREITFTEAPTEKQPEKRCSQTHSLRSHGPAPGRSHSPLKA